MKKAKQKYEVYYCTQFLDSDNGEILSKVRREYIGDTYAVSEKQAMNNVRFRFRSEGNPNGGYAENYYDGGGMTTSHSWYECKLA